MNPFFFTRIPDPAIYMTNRGQYIQKVLYVFVYTVFTLKNYKKPFVFDLELTNTE